MGMSPLGLFQSGDKKFDEATRTRIKKTCTSFISKSAENCPACKEKLMTIPLDVAVASGIVNLDPSMKMSRSGINFRICFGCGFWSF